MLTSKEVNQFKKCQAIAYIEIFIFLYIILLYWKKGIRIFSFAGSC